MVSPFDDYPCSHGYVALLAREDSVARVVGIFSDRKEAEEWTKQHPRPSDTYLEWKVFPLSDDQRYATMFVSVRSKDIWEAMLPRESRIEEVRGPFNTMPEHGYPIEIVQKALGTQMASRPAGTAPSKAPAKAEKPKSPTKREEFNRRYKSTGVCEFPECFNPRDQRHFQRFCVEHLASNVVARVATYFNDNMDFIGPKTAESWEWFERARKAGMLQEEEEKAYEIWLFCRLYPTDATGFVEQPDGSYDLKV